ncbi:hypothetical protein B0H13DRAFT_2571828 [Mycena leptocephala]|nr:hypothetical protein B0H13DRAFT_2571828 [Mycena leptocephala]
MSGTPSVEAPPQPTGPQRPTQQYTATALYDYIADPEDPFELSFNKGDILDIIDPQYKWWWVMKEDGSVGMAPSNYLRNGRKKFAVTAQNDYTANEDDRNEISFSKGEVLEILDQQGKWWQVRKADGSTGFAPSSHLCNEPDAAKAKDRKSFSAEINGILGASLWWQLQRADESTGLGAQKDLAEEPLHYKYKAKARFTYHGNPSDPNELSFRKGEVLEIAHKRGRWWLARKGDGSTGIAPSTFLEIIEWPLYERPGW